MKIRIAIWAIVGALVVVFWRIYLSATLSNPLGRGGIGRALVYLTCPIAMAGRHVLGFYVVLITNALTYALVGVIVETIRRYNHARWSPKLTQ